MQLTANYEEHLTMSNIYKIIASFVAGFWLLVVASQSFAAQDAIDISREISHRGFNPSKTSVAVIDVESGKQLAGHQADLTLNPASCAKIVTSAAALTTLGADYRFRTNFYTDRPLSGGSTGTLYVAGTGDPMLVNEAIDAMAKHMYKNGIRHVAGNIIIDNSFFDSYDFPRKGGNDTRAYTAKTSATAVNFNSVEVQITPGTKKGALATVATNPPTDYFRIVNKVITGGKPRLGISLKPENGRDLLTVIGRISPKAGTQEFYRSVTNPAIYAGEVIKYFLEQNGVKVDGVVKEGKAPSNSSLLVTEQSEPLSEIVKAMNKKSNNFIAEQMLKHLGAAKYGTPGSTAKGVRAVEDYLSSIGIPKGSYEFENGSGLSEVTQISAAQLVKVLQAAHKNRKISEAFENSLSILGVDGTTKKWHFAPSLTGRILVKTGTINGVSTLAGFVPLPNGHLGAFAILANALPRGAWRAHEAQLSIVKAIAEN